MEIKEKQVSMRWISFASGKKLRLGRLGGGRQKPIYETWVCRCDRADCRVLDGQRFVRGRGPQPRVTTPADCQCERVIVSGRRAQRASVRRPALLAGQGVASFVAQSCKDE